MKFESTKEQILEGGLNINTIVTDVEGRKFLKRNPKENPHVLKLIAHELHLIGFTDLGGQFRRRSSEEEGRFAMRAAQEGLRVLPPTYTDDKGISYYRFLSKIEPLDDFLPHASNDELLAVIYQLFTDLRLAHSKGFVYGDRWSPNILVTPPHDGKSLDLTHIDFDLEVSGPVARELDVMEAAYYTLCAGREHVIQPLSKMLALSEGWFNPLVVEQFMSRFATYFRHHKKYGHAENEVDALIAAMHIHRQFGTG